MPIEIPGAVTQALGAGMGLLLGSYNDARQYGQQAKLQNLQIQGMQQMAEFNLKKQLELWEKTGYGAQVKQMKAAGVNPGLLYGMGSGGGQTAAIQPGSVSGANGPVGGGEVGMGLQMQLLQAQKENIEADTELKKADTTNTDTDTLKKHEEIAVLAQQVTNDKIKENILYWEAAQERIQANILDQTKGSQMGLIISHAEQAASIAEKLERDNSIQAELREELKNKLKEECLSAAIQNELSNAQINKTGAEIQKIAAETATYITNMGIEWAKLSNEQKKTALYERMVKFNTAQSQRTYENILKAVGTIGGLFKSGNTTNIESQTKNIVIPPSN